MDCHSAAIHVMSSGVLETAWGPDPVAVAVATIPGGPGCGAAGGPGRRTVTENRSGSRPETSTVAMPLAGGLAPGEASRGSAWVPTAAT